MKRAVIFLNGNRPSRPVIFESLKTTDTIICANGGSKHALALGVSPHIVIGDQDSLPKTIVYELQKHAVEWISHPKDKDETDGELAIQFAHEKKFTDIVIFGFMGSRFDHMMALLLYLASDAVTFDSVTLLDEKQTLHIVKKKIMLTGKTRDYVSLIPLFTDAKGVTTTGLKWGLTNETLSIGKTRGVSNEFIGEKATVSLQKGVLLIVKNH